MILSDKLELNQLKKGTGRGRTTINDGESAQ